MSCSHILTVDTHTCDVHRELALQGAQLHGIEPGDTLHTAEDEVSLFITARHAFGELIVLQTVVHEVIAGLESLRMQTTQTMSGTHPYVPFAINLNTRDIFIGQTVSLTVACELAALQVKAVKALAGTGPYAPSLVFLDGIDLYVADDTVAVECVHPAPCFQV